MCQEQQSCGRQAAGVVNSERLMSARKHEVVMMVFGPMSGSPQSQHLQFERLSVRADSGKLAGMSLVSGTVSTGCYLGGGALPRPRPGPAPGPGPAPEGPWGLAEARATSRCRLTLLPGFVLVGFASAGSGFFSRFMKESRKLD